MNLDAYAHTHNLTTHLRLKALDAQTQMCQRAQDELRKHAITHPHSHF